MARWRRASQVGSEGQAELAGLQAQRQKAARVEGRPCAAAAQTCPCNTRCSCAAGPRAHRAGPVGLLHPAAEPAAVGGKAGRLCGCVRGWRLLHLAIVGGEGGDVCAPGPPDRAPTPRSAVHHRLLCPCAAGTCSRGCCTLSWTAGRCRHKWSAWKTHRSGRGGGTPRGTPCAVQPSESGRVAHVVMCLVFWCRSSCAVSCVT